ASCTRLAPFEALPDQLLLGLLHTALPFVPVEHDVTEGEDRFHVFTVDFADRRSRYELSASGYWQIMREDLDPDEGDDLAEDGPIDPADKLASEGQLYLKFGLLERAAAAFEQALEINPKHGAALQGLEMVLRAR